MEVILDTNFIITCIRRDIDFLEQLEAEGFTVVVPKEVLEELKDLRFRVTNDERTAINVALELLEKRKVKKMSLGHYSVDKGLINKGKEGYFIATLDSAIRHEVPNVVGIRTAQKSIVIEKKIVIF